MTVVRSGGDPDEGRGGPGGPEGPGGRTGRSRRVTRSDPWGPRDTREGDVADATAGEAGSGALSPGPEGCDSPQAWGPHSQGTADDASHLDGPVQKGDVGDSGRLAPQDRPWTPIPRPARPLDAGLIPAQRRLKKTSRSA